jgi:hypothetical protein
VAHAKDSTLSTASAPRLLSEKPLVLWVLEDSVDNFCDVLEAIDMCASQYGAPIFDAHPQ